MRDANQSQIPAFPEALLLLRTLLDERFADLRAITETIRGDVGLTVSALQLAADEPDVVPAEVLNISEIVVHLGLENLRTMISSIPTLTERAKAGVVLDRCQRFWMHARLTALIAEGHARQAYGLNPEHAYVAGLVRRLASLPTLLACESSDHHNPTQSGRETTWRLPGPLLDVIRGKRSACRTRLSRSLLDLANDADRHAGRLEFACL